MTETVVLEIGAPDVDVWNVVGRLTANDIPGTLTIAGMPVMFGWDRGEGPAVWSVLPRATIGHYRVVSAQSVRILFDITEDHPFVADHAGPTGGLKVRIRLEGKGQ